MSCGGCDVDGNLGDELADGVGYGFAPSEEEGTKLGEKQLLALLDRTVVTKGSFVPGTKEELMMARFLAIEVNNLMESIKIR